MPGEFTEGVVVVAREKVVELGLDTFGDVTEGEDGESVSQAQTIRDVIAEGILADEVGVDFFGVGEHHRPDFAVSSPEMVLASIASRTEKIRLGSAVTVLSSDDPVRVYQRFSTLDAASNGRAEVILGRGSFTESFPLFGLDLAQYDQLFEEKLDLFVELMQERGVTWSGSTRAALQAQRIFPTTESGSLQAWVGVGGSPESVVRAAHYGLPLVLAIIGGDPRRFAPYIDLYRRALSEFGHGALPIAVHSPGYVAESDDQAREVLWPYFKEGRDRIGASRGWPPVTRAQFDQEASADGSLYVGSADTVAAKIARTFASLDIDRFDLKYSSGRLPHQKLMQNIELYGTQVAPRVRELVAEESALLAG
jgi:probable LLM family oxidoreductase